MQRWLSWWGFPIASSTEGYDWEREPIAPLFSFSWKTFVLLLSFGQKMLSVSLLPCGLHWNDEHIAVPLRRKKSWRKCSRAGAPSRHCFDGTWRVVASDLEPAKTVVGYTICFNHPIYPKNPGTHQKRQRLSWPFKVKVPPPQQYRRPSSHWQRKWKRTGAQQWVCCPAPRCIAGDAGGGVESSTHGGKGYPVSRGSGTTRQLTQWKSLCVLVTSSIWSFPPRYWMVLALWPSWPNSWDWNINQPHCAGQHRRCWKKSPKASQGERCSHFIKMTCKNDLQTIF